MDNNKIEEVLKSYNIDETLDGYKYLVDSILLYEDTKIMKLYDKVATKNNTNYKNVERSIRYLHDKMYVKIDDNIFNNYKSTNKTIIIKLYNKIKSS